jgi:hypothetical protein
MTLGTLSQVDLSFPSVVDANGDTGSFLQEAPPGVGINTPGATAQTADLPGTAGSTSSSSSSSGLVWLLIGGAVLLAVAAK